MGAPVLFPGDRVYIAARFERQAEASAFADELVKAGLRVTSRWLLIPDLAVPENAPERARMDLDDLRRADAYVLLSDDVPGRGGKDFEAGFAYATAMCVIVVGPPVHVFHFLPGVRRFRDLADLLAHLSTKEDARA
jgi:hypothetical protein